MVCFFSFFCLGKSLHAKTATYSPKTLRFEYSSNGKVIVADTIKLTHSAYEAAIEDILIRSDEEANFKVKVTEEGRVEAVFENAQRFIYLDAAYLNQIDSPAARLVILSLAVGHQINQHQFRSGFSDLEAYEAAEFAGYMLYEYNFPPETIEEIPGLLPELVPADQAEWLRSFRFGYERAEAALAQVPSSGFADNGRGSVISGVREFPFPPGSASANDDLTKYFQQAKTLGDIASKLEEALNAYGYYESSYFYVNGGFVLVTRMEQFNSDGSCLESDVRWSVQPKRQYVFSEYALLDYLASLFYTEACYFRVFAFVVTDQVWSPDPNRKVSQDVAMGWLSEGANRLPDILAKKEKTASTNVKVLIYEYEVKIEAQEKVTFKRPSEMLGRKHLEKSKIIHEIRK